LVLQGVPGIVEDGDIGALDLAGEVLDRFLHRGTVGIEAERGVEAETLQRRRHVLGVIARIPERRNVAVVGVADHERDAPLGRRRREPD
jgi:hypothetical protein